MKLTHIFWALLLLVLILYVPSLFYRTNAKLGGGPELVAFYLFLWIAVTIVSAAIIILKKLGVIKSGFGFWMTLLVFFNSYFGSYGTYMILSGQFAGTGPLMLSTFILNIILAVFLLLPLVVTKGKNPSNQ